MIILFSLYPFGFYIFFFEFWIFFIGLEIIYTSVLICITITTQFYTARLGIFIFITTKSTMDFVYIIIKITKYRSLVIMISCWQWYFLMFIVNTFVFLLIIILKFSCRITPLIIIQSVKLINWLCLNLNNIIYLWLLNIGSVYLSFSHWS